MRVFSSHDAKLRLTTVSPCTQITVIVAVTDVTSSNISQKSILILPILKHQQPLIPEDLRAPCLEPTWIRNKIAFGCEWADRGLKPTRLKSIAGFGISAAVLVQSARTAVSEAGNRLAYRRFVLLLFSFANFLSATRFAPLLCLRFFKIGFFIPSLFSCSLTAYS